eukprot:15476501-Alexandrium_andersonii.AAC.1
MAQPSPPPPRAQPDPPARQPKAPRPPARQPEASHRARWQRIVSGQLQAWGAHGQSPTAHRPR